LPIGLKKINFLDFGAGNAHVSRTFKSILKDDVNIYCLESNPLCKNLYSKYKLIQLEGINEVSNHIDLIYMIEVIEKVCVIQILDTIEISIQYIMTRILSIMLELLEGVG
jgi:hypothetical protein